jgi:6-pyruvoyltetrahydropterin/6-carboxytetrahydropterin synthase
VEIRFQATDLDNAGMVMDFGLMGNIRQLVDSFDHSHDMWSKEPEETISFFQRINERWVILPFNPTAEMLSLLFYAYARYILEHTGFTNGEKEVNVLAVRYHETETGYAEASREDFEHIWIPNYNLSDIVFSEGIRKEWSKELKEMLLTGKRIVNPQIPLQIK